MIGIFNTISIDGTEIYRSNGFTLSQEFIHAGEITTCTGDYHADVVGWKYGDLTLSYDALPQSQLAVLLGLSGKEMELTFSDMANNTVTEKAVPTVLSGEATRLEGYDGAMIWSGISLGVKFLNAHNT